MIISDLHIHSKYSRATSGQLSIDNLEKWARIKGINLLGTGDFTHPKWIQEIKENLTEEGNGILKSKNNFPFILQTEISLIYTDLGKGRKIHNIVFAPDLDAASKINTLLEDDELRSIFGVKGRENILKQYSQDVALDLLASKVKFLLRG